MAECTKPPMAGSGVCPGQTTGRGILDDAVALVRGDRFLSYDFNSSTLTNWGASKISESAPGAYGGMLPTVLMNALPGAWTGTSSYALLPFYTPRAARGILKGNNVIEKYDTERPSSGKDIVGVHTQAGCKAVFEVSLIEIAPRIVSAYNQLTTRRTARTSALCTKKQSASAPMATTS
jgi:hypothetical protein